MSNYLAEKYHVLLEVDAYSDKSIDVGALRKALDDALRAFVPLGEVRLVVSETPKTWEDTDEDAAESFVRKFKEKHGYKDEPATRSVLADKASHKATGEASTNYFNGSTKSSSWYVDPDTSAEAMAKYGLAACPIPPRHVSLTDISEPSDGTEGLRPAPVGMKTYVETAFTTVTSSKAHDDLFDYSLGRKEKTTGKKYGKTTGLPSFVSKDGEWQGEWEWPMHGEKGFALTLSAKTKSGWDPIETLTDITQLTDTNDVLSGLTQDLFKKLSKVPTTDSARSCNVFQRWAKSLTPISEKEAALEDAIDAHIEDLGDID